MLMIAIISFFARAVNHSIRGLAGTLHATRPVAMQCLRLAELIRRLPSGIFYLHVQSTQPISAFRPNFHLNFNIVYISVSHNSPTYVSRAIRHIFLICVKKSEATLKFKCVNLCYSHMACWM